MLFRTYLVWGCTVLAAFGFLGATGVRSPRIDLPAESSSSSYSSGYYGGHGSGGSSGSSGFGWGK